MNTLPKKLLGANGSSFVESLIEADSVSFNQKVADIIRTRFTKESPFVLRLPSGAGAKLMSPIKSDGSLANGWGLDSNAISGYYATIGGDEDGSVQESLDKWLEKAEKYKDSQSFLAYICNFINDNGLGEIVRIIWVANIWTASASILESVLDYFASENIKVIGVELGNEAYSQSLVSEYLQLIPQYIEVVKLSVFDIKIGIPIPKRNSAEKRDWYDTLLISNIEYDAVVYHPYLTSNEGGVPFSLIPERDSAVVVTEEIRTNLNSACLSLANVGSYFMSSDTLGIKSDFEDKELWITEFNTKPSEKFGNTFGNACFLFDVMLQAECDILCVHNFVAPDYYGIISKVSKAEVAFGVSNEGEYILRSGLLSLEYASILSGKNVSPISYDSSFDTERIGENKYAFINTSGNSMSITIEANHFLERIKEVRVDSCFTQNMFAGVGLPAFVGKNWQGVDESFRTGTITESSINVKNSKFVEVIIHPRSFGVVTIKSSRLGLISGFKSRSQHTTVGI